MIKGCCGLFQSWLAFSTLFFWFCLSSSLFCVGRKAPKPSDVKWQTERGMSCCTCTMLVKVNLHQWPGIETECSLRKLMAGNKLKGGNDRYVRGESCLSEVPQQLGKWDNDNHMDFHRVNHQVLLWGRNNLSTAEGQPEIKQFCTKGPAPLQERRPVTQWAILTSV